MKTNGTLCQLPDLRGGATHQFRKAGARNAPWSAAWEDSHRPQSLKRCRAFDENLFNIFDWLTRRIVETVYIYMTNWYSQSLRYSENGIAHAQIAFLYIIFFCERFEPRSHFKRLSLIVRVNELRTFTLGNVKSLRTVIHWQILKKVILNFV